MGSVGRLVAAALLCWCAIPAVSPAASEPDCTACHPSSAPGLAPHPLDVPVAGRIAGDAAGLPLDGGRITCLTCHTHHGAGSDTPRPHFLRAAPAELCARCHFADGAWDRAHANYPDTVHGGVWLAGPDGPPADPQEISRRCLVCHAAGHGQAGTAAAPPINIEVSHPLAVYAQLAGPGYRPADQLGPAVRLFDGRIGCASCHRVYSRHAALLSTAPQKQLCTSCHDFDGQIARR